MTVIKINILIIIIFSLLSIISLSNENNITNKSYTSDITIYLSAHKDFRQIVQNREVYKILTDSKSSLKNKYTLDAIYTDKKNDLYPKRIAYSELSKLYYVYKNIRPLTKYVGFCQYRRFFTFLDSIPNINEIFEDHDAILLEHYHLENKTVKEWYYQCIKVPGSLDEIVQIIKEKFPEYSEDADKELESKKHFILNMFIMKREDFLRYCEFMYTVFEEYDRRHRLRNDTEIKNYVKNCMIKNKVKNLKSEIGYQRRLHAVLSERIGAIFYRHNFKKIYEIPLLDYDKINQLHDYSYEKIIDTTNNVISEKKKIIEL